MQSSSMLVTHISVSSVLGASPWVYGSVVSYFRGFGGVGCSDGISTRSTFLSFMSTILKPCRLLTATYMVRPSFDTTNGRGRPPTGMCAAYANFSRSITSISCEHIELIYVYLFL